MSLTRDQRPVQVSWAIGLFWLTIMLGALKLGRTLSMNAGAAGHSFTVFTFVAIYSLMALLTIYVTLGASWARGGLVVLFLIGILPGVALVIAHFQAIPLLAALTCAQAVSQIIGLYLVYREPAASWFGRPLPK